MRGRSRAFRTGSADILSALGIPAASLAPHFGPARTVCSRVHHLWIGSVPSLRIERYASQARQGEIQGNGVWIDQIQGKPPILEFASDEFKFVEFHPHRLPATPELSSGTQLDRGRGSHPPPPPHPQRQPPPQNPLHALLGRFHSNSLFHPMLKRAATLKRAL